MTAVYGVAQPPPHDEDRARREFRLLTAEQARERARQRLLDWLAEHPRIRPTPRQED